QLARQLQAQDQVTLIAFSRQPKILADSVPGNNALQLANLIASSASDGGTNLEAALKAGFEKALDQKVDGAQNRVILITDGAANLGDAEPDRLAKIVEFMRNNGIAFDAAGVGAEGYNDEILETLTRDGDGRYYFLNKPEDADEGFAKQIAGALRPAAMNVKIQVQFNPDRVGKYKLLGFEKHRLNKEDFRDDTVDAAEMAAEEAGVAVYQIEPLPEGRGDIGTVSVRFRDVSSGRMVERKWPIPYEASAYRINEAATEVRVASVAALFAAKLKDDPVGDRATYKDLANIVNTLPANVKQNTRVQQLQTMIQQARQQKGDE
ncbi:MAG: YfbK domain-containing protein, partial [Verrucomicrobiota bacterium]